MQKSCLRRKEERISIANTLFSQYGTEISKMISFHIDDVYLAEDMYQNLFLSIIKYPPPEDLSDPKSYLWKAIFNNVNQMRYKQLNDDRKLVGYKKRLFDIPHDTTNDPLEILSMHESRNNLIEIIQKSLSPAEAKVVLEKLKHHTKTQEIASQLGIESRSVSHYFSTGIKKLRALLYSNERLLEEYV